MNPRVALKYGLGKGNERLESNGSRSAEKEV